MIMANVITLDNEINMKFIKPIVGISKVVENVDNVICGFNGVLSKGNNINADALKALTECAKAGKEVVVLSNSYMRVNDLAELIKQGDAELLNYVKSIISAGEVLHYLLKNPKTLGLVGKKYYNIGLKTADTVFAGLDYQEVSEISKADFIYMGAVKAETDTVEMYTSELEYASSLGLDFLCVGNDTATYMEGEVCLASGSVAEQYALLGGRVITFGKPDSKLAYYAKESFSNKTGKVLFIGDSFTTDMKTAKILDADMVLISKGIHVNFLGEGYIPDVEKTRNLAQDYEVYPDYVMSGLRW